MSSSFGQGSLMLPAAEVYYLLSFPFNPSALLLSLCSHFPRPSPADLSNSSQVSLTPLTVSCPFPPHFISWQIFVSLYGNPWLFPVEMLKIELCFYFSLISFRLVDYNREEMSTFTIHIYHIHELLNFILRQEIFSTKTSGNSMK